jgi:cytoskeletal protein RodZ
MKRCSECEFVYEDEQSLCDMDGADLVFDPRPLPGEDKTSPQPLNAGAKSSWKSVVIVALAGFALCVALLIYYRLRHRTKPQNTNHSSAKVAIDSQSAPTPEPPAATATPAPSESPTANVKARKSAAPIVKPSSARFRSAAPTREQKKPEKKPEPENANQKKESRIGSILKKTGRILKKPFKL